MNNLIFQSYNFFQCRILDHIREFHFPSTYKEGIFERCARIAPKPSLANPYAYFTSRTKKHVVVPVFVCNKNQHDNRYHDCKNSYCLRYVTTSTFLSIATAMKRKIG